MNVTEHLLSSNPSPDSPRWHLLRPADFQVLPCRTPFEISDSLLTPAIQACAMQRHADAGRFLELRRLSCGWSDSRQWSLRLLEAMMLVEQGRADEGWHQLQLALSWRNQREEEAVMLDTVPAIAVSEWLVMATVALATKRIEAAESYVCEAVAQIEKCPTCCLSDVLQDTRGDAMTVFATIRLAQHRFQEAEMLLELAYDAHLQSGDMEQMAVDLILMSDVEHHSSNPESATFILFEAELILKDECDSTRHLRCGALAEAVSSRLLEHKNTRRHKASGTLCLN